MDKNIKKDRYIWYRDEKMVGTILLIFVAAMQVFAFLKVPVISTIHAYTVGMLFGFFNPWFYFFIGYIAIKMIFKEKIVLAKWIKLNYWKYWFVVISAIFISTSTFHYQDSTGYTSIGSKPWLSFTAWFHDFTSSTAWAPTQTNGGMIGVFLYSLTASAISGIGAVILSISLLVLSVSLVVTGSFVGLYRNIKNRHCLDVKAKEQKADDELNFDSYIASDKPESKTDLQKSETVKIENKPPIKEDILSESIEEKKMEEEDLPFEDPFA